MFSASSNIPVDNFSKPRSGESKKSRKAARSAGPATTPGPVDYVALRVALGMPRAAARRVSRQVRAAAELYAAGRLTGRQLGARACAATRAALAGGAA